MIMSKHDCICSSGWTAGCLVALGFALALLLAAAHARADEAVLTVEGLGSVHLGMTIAQAEAKLGAKLGRMSLASDGFADESEPSEPCEQWRRRDGGDAGIAYMVEHGVITRIEAYRPKGAPVPAVRIATGVGIGTRRADLDELYGNELRLDGHPLSESAQWAIVERAGDAGIRIVVTEGAVTSLFTARGPALDYPEGCS